MSDLAETIAKRVRIVRSNESQEEFAAQLGVSKGTIGKYERGLMIPGGDVLARMREIYGADINWLLTGDRKGTDFLVKGEGQPDLAIEAKFVPTEVDEDLGELVAISISSAYESMGVPLHPGTLGKMVVRIYADAMRFKDKGERQGFAAGAVVTIFREVKDSLVSKAPEATGKRRA